MSIFKKPERKKDELIEKKNVLELYKEGSDIFKERFEALPIEKKAAAIVVIVSMECKSKELESWLIGNYAPLISSMCREKFNEGYPLENALEILQEGIEARILPQIKKTFRIKNCTITPKEVSLYPIGICGYLNISIESDGSFGSQKSYRFTTRHITLSDFNSLTRSLEYEFSKQGFSLKKEDLARITLPVSEYYRQFLEKKELAETAQVWTIKNSEIPEFPEEIKEGYIKEKLEEKERDDRHLNSLIFPL